jgi:3-methylcrotonyl-CoA carboxylase alpha subunit
MEMNTRLQVEHPVTESITGVDLVEWQLRVAAGEPIPLAQADIPMKGWAMEARLYAEDPAHGFLPSIGKLDHFVMPDDIRVDTGVEQGGEVSQFYDPMIAKLIVHEDSREAAAARLADACREVEVWPVRTNAGFLARCLDHPRFVEGDVDTGFIAEEEGALATSGPSAILLAEVANHALDRGPPDTQETSVWSSLAGVRGFRVNANPVKTVHLWLEDGQQDVVPADGATYQRTTIIHDDRIVGFEEGLAHAFRDRAPTITGSGAGSASDGGLRAPMPGKIVAAPAKAGDVVAKGQPIVVLEAMKMEHALTAPFDGVVAEFNVAVGDQVTDGAVLAVVKAADAT